MHAPTLTRALALVTGFSIVITALPPASAAYGIQPDGSWGPAEDIPFQGGTSITALTIASNRTGTVLAVGYQFVGLEANIYATFYRPGVGWDALETVNETGFNGATGMAVALGDDGSAFVLFVSDPFGNETLMASRYTAATGWGTPARLSSGPVESFPSIALDGQGGAMAGWVELTTGVAHPWASRYILGSGWSTPERLDLPETAPVGFLILQWSGGRTYIAAWDQLNAPYSITQLRSFDPASGWGSTVKACSMAPQDCLLWDLVAGPDGSAFFSVLEWDNTTFASNTSVRAYSVSGGLGAVNALDASSFVWAPATLARDAGGNVTAIWSQRYGPDDRPYAARYEPATGWGAKATIGTPGYAYRTPFFIAGENGAVTAVWALTDWPGQPLAFSRFLPGVGWSTPAPLGGTASGYFHGLVALPGGRAMLAVQPYAGAASFTFEPFDRVAPTVQILNVASGAAVADASVVIRGVTEPGASVLVNGVAASVDSAGAFAARIPLGTGDNLVEAVATDAAGNEGRASVHVTYEDPLPALQSQLASAQANETALASQLALVNAQLASVEANATALATDLTRTESDLASSQENVSLLGDAIASANAQITTLRANFTALEQRVANSNGTANQPASPAAENPLALLLGVVGTVLGAAGLGAAMYFAKRARGANAWAAAGDQGKRGTG